MGGKATILCQRSPRRIMSMTEYLSRRLRCFIVSETSRNLGHCACVNCKLGIRMYFAKAVAKKPKDTGMIIGPAIVTCRIAVKSPIAICRSPG